MVIVERKCRFFKLPRQSSISLLDKNRCWMLHDAEHSKPAQRLAHQFVSFEKNTTDSKETWNSRTSCNSWWKQDMNIELKYSSRPSVIKSWKNELNLLQMAVTLCVIACYIAVDFLKLMLFAVDLFDYRLGFLCLWWNFCGVEEGEGEWSSRKFQGWNSRVPVLEVGSSTTGTRLFHCWKSRVPPTGTQFRGLLSITSWLVLIGIKTCPQWRDDLFSMTWRPVLDDMTSCSWWHDGLFSIAWRPVLDDMMTCSQWQDNLFSMLSSFEWNCGKIYCKLNMFWEIYCNIYSWCRMGYKGLQ